MILAHRHMLRVVDVRVYSFVQADSADNHRQSDVVDVRVYSFVQADSADNHRQSDATQQLDQFKYENDKLKIALAQRSLIAYSVPSHAELCRNG